MFEPALIVVGVIVSLACFIATLGLIVEVRSKWAWSIPITIVLFYWSLPIFSSKRHYDDWKLSSYSITKDDSIKATVVRDSRYTTWLGFDIINQDLYELNCMSTEIPCGFSTKTKVEMINKLLQNS